jgi:hypothetical protein
VAGVLPGEEGKQAAEEQQAAMINSEPFILLFHFHPFIFMRRAKTIHVSVHTIFDRWKMCTMYSGKVDEQKQLMPQFEIYYNSHTTSSILE